MSNPPPIDTLVKAARGGEAEAWNILYRQYYPAVYTIALRLCADATVAKDVAQDSFVTAYMKLEQLKDVAAFGGWIKKIVTHHCYRIQDRRILQTSLDKVLIESDGWWEDELNAKLDQLSTKSRLHAALTHLPEALRSTVLLRYFSNFKSYEEIARILSVPVGTIRSRLNQAKLKLSEYWEKFADAGINIYKEQEEWNEFYFSIFTSLHRHDVSKNRFVNHLHKNVQVVLPDGKLDSGRKLFDKMIYEDRRFGSWLTPTNVASAGNISIVEAKHYNSTEHPFHCPPSSVLVLYRNKTEAHKISFHFSVR